jgi:hypothetical protein
MQTNTINLEWKISKKYGPLTYQLFLGKVVVGEVQVIGDVPNKIAPYESVWVNLITGEKDNVYDEKPTSICKEKCEDSVKEALTLFMDPKPTVFEI